MESAHGGQRGAAAVRGEDRRRGSALRRLRLGEAAGEETRVDLVEEEKYEGRLRVSCDPQINYTSTNGNPLVLLYSLGRVK